MDRREYYAFTWPGKREAIHEAGKAPIGSLRPCVELSKNFETTQNLYIEGDNLEVLKLLQKSYMRKVKMIYIDPPYNTGHDFIYKDSFIQEIDEAADDYGLFNDEGEMNFSHEHYRENTKSNPRYHSDWCSMIYPRLKVAHNLLREDGVIFISIDDNEQANLRKMCDEIFGENNFIAQFIWQSKKGGGNDSIHIAIEHEYILAYARNISRLGEFYEAYTEDYSKRYNEEDEEGKFYWDTFKRKAGKQYYPITCPDGTVLQYDDDGNPISWLRSKPRFEDDVKKGDIRFVNINGRWSVQFKQRMPIGKTPRSMLTDKGTTSAGTKDFYELFRQNIFSNPKPIELIKHLMSFTTDDNSIILDFFSGSSTTAHAVMQLNAEDSGTRKFIMIQLPEDCQPQSEAYRACYKTICDIGRERIRRAGENLTGDTGFRVLKLDSSNFYDVYVTPDELTQDMLDDMVENIKPDRSGLDLLFGFAASCGLPLSLAYECRELEGLPVHVYGDGEIVACFEPCVPQSVVIAMAEMQPVRGLFRDSCFASSQDKLNALQLFEGYAPDSVVTVL